MTLQMVFDNPKLISRLPDGEDSVSFEILNKKLFKAENSNLKLSTSRLTKIEGAVP